MKLGTMMLRRRNMMMFSGEDCHVVEEDLLQDQDPRLARACAVEMHVDVEGEPPGARISR